MFKSATVNSVQSVMISDNLLIRYGRYFGRPEELTVASVG